jgi:hypothetical protein
MINEKVDDALVACDDAITFYVVNNDLDKIPARELLVRPLGDRAALAHVRWLIRETHALPASQLEVKRQRLGFAQGVLWACGVCSLSDLRNMNEPSKEE